MKKAIITGASDGLGRNIAEEFIKRGIQVVCLSRRNPDPAMVHIPVDIMDSGSVAGAVETILGEHPDADVLINCAGVFDRNAFEMVAPERILQVMAINVGGLMQLTRGLLPLIKKNKGDIVNIGSTASFKACHLETIYSTSKWAVRGFTENLRLEVKAEDVRVIGFHPGGMKTSLFKDFEIDTGAFMEPSDVAKLLLMLLELPRNMEVSEIVINRKSA